MTAAASRERLLVVCEGETEVAYLTEVVRALGISADVTVRRSLGTAPRHLARAAREALAWSQTTQEAPYTEAWAVFDRDHHLFYEATIREAGILSPPVRVCWTNPCLEFWFWLHYEDDLRKLPLDDVETLEDRVFEMPCADGTVEVIRALRQRRSVKSQTMFAIFKRRCPGYAKARCPQGILSRTGEALDRLKAVAQSTDPMQMGSAMPQLLKRFLELQESQGVGRVRFGLQKAGERLADVTEDEAVKRLSVEEAIAVAAAELRRIDVRPGGFVASPEAWERLRLCLTRLAAESASGAVRAIAAESLAAYCLLREAAPHGSFPRTEAARVAGLLSDLRRRSEALIDVWSAGATEAGAAVFKKTLHRHGIFRPNEFRAAVKRAVAILQDKQRLSVNELERLEALRELLSGLWTAVQNEPEAAHLTEALEALEAARAIAAAAAPLSPESQAHAEECLARVRQAVLAFSQRKAPTEKPEAVSTDGASAASERQEKLGGFWRRLRARLGGWRRLWSR